MGSQVPLWGSQVRGPTWIFWGPGSHLGILGSRGPTCRHPGSRVLLFRYAQTNRHSNKKVNILTLSGYFPFFISFFCWNEINEKSSRKDTRKIRSSHPQPATLLKKRLCHRCFPANFAKLIRTPFLTEHLQWLLLKD